MDKRQLKAGTKIIFGAPANPMPAVMADAIGQVVAQIPGILEAYIPQCYVEGDTEARQVLVLGVRSKDDIPMIMQQLTEKMQLLLPTGRIMDILPFASSSLPPEARVEKCVVFRRAQKSWWRIW